MEANPAPLNSNSVSPTQIRIRAFMMFLGIFSWAHFILMASMGLDLGWNTLTLWNLGILISASCLIMRPASILCILAHSFFWVAFEFHKAPGGPNHLLLMTLTSLGILVGVGGQWLFGLGERERGWEQTCQRLIGFGRWQLIILYFFAVFHKLNHDFFDTSISCGVVMVLDILQHIPGNSKIESLPFPMAAILMTLVFETLVPALLCFKRTRFWGVLIGFWFHFILSFHPNLYVLSFSFEVQAMYLLFLPFPELKRIREDFLGRLGWFRESKFFYESVFVIAAMGAFGFCVWLGHSGFDQWFRRGFRLIWMIWVGVVGVYLVWGRFFRSLPDKNEVPVVDPSGWRPGWILIPVTALTFLNGWTPYLGWKTNSNFSMFSNLRTETGISNHLVIRHPLGGWTSEDHMVQVLDTTDPFLGRIRDLNDGDREWHIPEVLLRRRAFESQDPGFTVVYKTLNGSIEFASKSEEVRSLLIEKGWEEDAKVFSGVSWLERKFLDFRAIPLDGKPIPCLH